jgi:hypothetical protein
MVRGRRAEAPVQCSDVSFRLDKKTANFKVWSFVSFSREMQWSNFTEENQKNQLAQTESHAIKMMIKMRAGVIT